MARHSGILERSDWLVIFLTPELTDFPVGTIFFQKKMKSTLFLSLIALLFMAGNVQAKCPSAGCGDKKYCSNGQCKDKKLGARECSDKRECHSNICNKFCGCTSQTGNNGCIAGHYCDTSRNKCELKKNTLERCVDDFECKSDNCFGFSKVCR